ncbi:MAG TPA: hypothetical protein VKZ18_23045 [Polyangia bacterium]|nr:hypothetical protein [Polyangia bacterium]
MSMRVRETIAVAALAGLLGVGGCQRRDDAGKPAPVPPLDPAAGAALPATAAVPPPSAQPAPAQPAAAQPAAAEPAPARTAADDPGASITGAIVLTPAMAKARAKMGPTGTLYLVARRISDNPTARGTLIAVKKMPADKFPLPFALTAADMPFQNGPFDGDLTLTARIDQDGDPLTHEKGDVFGTLAKVRVGSRDVKLALDQVQKETESLASGAPIMGGLRGPAGGAGELPPGHPAMGGGDLPPGHP